MENLKDLNEFKKQEELKESSQTIDLNDEFGNYGTDEEMFITLINNFLHTIKSTQEGLGIDKISSIDRKTDSFTIDTTMSDKDGKPFKQKYKISLTKTK